MFVNFTANSDRVILPSQPRVPIGPPQTFMSFAIFTNPVSTRTTVTITGTDDHGNVKTALLTLSPSPVALLSPFSGPVVAGQTATGQVQFQRPVPAGGILVALDAERSLPGAIPGSRVPLSGVVPASVFVPGGMTSATYAVTTSPLQRGVQIQINATVFESTTSTILQVARNPPVGNAFYDPSFRTPRCFTVDRSCDTGGLIDGMGMLTDGPEAQAPNTIQDSCAEVGPATNAFHQSASLDRLRVSTVDGSRLGEDKLVTVEATAWADSSPDLRLDLFSAPSATNPVWTLVARLTPTSSDSENVLSTTFKLSIGTLQAIRGSWTHAPTPMACTNPPPAGYSSFDLDDRDDLVFSVDALPNDPPVVNAGPDQAVTLPDGAVLGGKGSDDGLPSPPSLLTMSWSMVSGPGIVTFRAPESAVTPATFSAAGIYTLRLTVTDGEFTISDYVSVTVNPALPVNQPPLVNAGPDQVIVLPAAASLAGIAGDDGLPNPPAQVAVRWFKMSGPGTVTFANASAAATTATFSLAGTYVLRLTADDGALTSEDTVTLVISLAPPANQPPVVNAGTDQIVILPALAALSGTVVDDGRPNPPATVTTTWSKVSGPGTVIFGKAGALATTAVFSLAGSYVLRLRATDGVLTTSDDVGITVNVTTVKVQYRVTETASNDNQIKPHFNIVNTGTTAVALSSLKVRYWYTVDTQQPESSACDFAAIGCGKITRTFATVTPVRPKADHYLEVGFTSAAGSLAPGARTGEIQLRWHKNDFSNYNEANDHSADLTRLSFVDWTRVTLYRNGIRIWGAEP